MAALSRVAMLATMGLVAALLFPTALSYDFNNETCPTLVNMVREEVEKAIAEDVGVVAGLLQITFHDCFTQGCDASLLLTGDKSEQDMPQNAGLRKNVLDLIESIRATVHAQCGPKVSCADITNLATNQAVTQSGLPGYRVPLGRDDSLGPATEEQVNMLPRPDDSISNISQIFYRRGGFDVSHVVALSGAHTIGRANCSTFANRKEENNDFAKALKRNCTFFPVAPLQDLDVETPRVFDNQYYINLLANKGVLNSDMELTRNEFTNGIVNEFARDQGWFFTTFSHAMQIMAHLEGESSGIGKIRRNCFKVNGPVEEIAKGSAASA